MKESLVIKSIKQYLQVLENQHKLVFYRANSLNVKTAYGGYINSGKKGFPDLVCYLQGGKTIFIECKGDNGKQSVEQELMQEKLQSLGYLYIVTKNVIDVMNIIKKEAV